VEGFDRRIIAIRFLEPHQGRIPYPTRPRMARLRCS
jgi:hypothetical protein